MSIGPAWADYHDSSEVCFGDKDRVYGKQMLHCGTYTGQNCPLVENTGDNDRQVYAADSELVCHIRVAQQEMQMVSLDYRVV